MDFMSAANPSFLCKLNTADAKYNFFEKGLGKLGPYDIWSWVQLTWLVNDDV